MAGYPIERLMGDLRLAVRSAIRGKAFTAIAVFTLALGIGANTAMFSLVNAVLLRPLPYPQPEKLAILWTANARLHVNEIATSWLNYVDWRGQQHSFSEIGMYAPFSRTVVTADGGMRVVTAGFTASAFRVLGVTPVLGRVFTDQDEEQRERVALISSRFWKSQFGGSPDVLGKEIRITGQYQSGQSSIRTSRIIGVLPDEFLFPEKDCDVWEPYSLMPWMNNPRHERNDPNGQVIGRLKKGVTMEQARAEMEAIGKRLEAQYPDNRNFSVRVVPLHSQLTGPWGRPLTLLLACVAMVLLIACVNVANLVLARGRSRDHEMAIRVALGADRMRLVAQLLWESLAISAAAAAAGVLLAWGAVRILIRMGPADVPRLAQAGIDWTVLIYTALLCIATGMLVGVIPAWYSSGRQANEVLQEGGRSAMVGRGIRRTSDYMVVAEVALAVTLLAGAGLLIRSLRNALSTDPGFEAHHVLALEGQLHQHASAAERPVYFEEVVRKVREIPGVREAGVAGSVMTTSQNPLLSITAEGAAQDQTAPISQDTVGSGFFEAMGVPLLRGRFFGPGDNMESPQVILINQTLAQRYWPGQDPIGKRVKFGRPEWRTVVGVVGNMRRQGLDREPIPQLFIPHRQQATRWMTLVVRTSVPPSTLKQAVEAAARSVDKTVPWYGVATLDQLLDERIGQRRFQTLLLGLFAGVAILMAALGVYGLLHHSVSLRRHEIGVRMAMGASPGAVIRMIVAQGLRRAAAGLALGFLGSLALTTWLESWLYQVGSTDPVTAGAVVVLILLVTIVASLGPAGRAALVDPVAAMRAK